MDGSTVADTIPPYFGWSQADIEAELSHAAAIESDAEFAGAEREAMLGRAAAHRLRAAGLARLLTMQFPVAGDDPARWPALELLESRWKPETRRVALLGGPADGDDVDILIGDGGRLFSLVIAQQTDDHCLVYELREPDARSADQVPPAGARVLGVYEQSDAYVMAWLPNTATSRSGGTE